MARITLAVAIEVEIVTQDEALATAKEETDGDEEEELQWIQQHPEVYPIPAYVYKVTCNGKAIPNAHEDYAEQRYILLGSKDGGDYALTVTHYIP